MIMMVPRKHCLSDLVTVPSMPNFNKNAALVRKAEHVLA